MATRVTFTVTAELDSDNEQTVSSLHQTLIGLLHDTKFRVDVSDVVARDTSKPKTKLRAIDELEKVSKAGLSDTLIEMMVEFYHQGQDGWTPKEIEVIDAYVEDIILAVSTVTEGVVDMNNRYDPEE